MKKVKARPYFADDEDAEEFSLLNIPTDIHGYITGWYGGNGWMVGDIVEVTDEYINFEWWCPINESTLKEVEK